MLNKIIMIARLCADPEQKMTQNGKLLTECRVACQRDFKDPTTGSYPSDFFSVTVFGRSAEFLAKNFHKGDLITITGRIENSNFTDSNGQARTVTRIKAETVEFVPSSRNADESAQSNDYIPSAYSQPSFAKNNANTFEEVEMDENLPF